MLDSYTCRGEYACPFAGAEEGNVTIGPRSCRGQGACPIIGGEGFAFLGEDTCTGKEACMYAGASEGNASLGSGSCAGQNSCERAGFGGKGIATTIIKSRACRGPASCQDVGRDGVGMTSIGSDSCYGERSCYNVGRDGSGSIDNFMCFGPYICRAQDEFAPCVGTDVKITVEFKTDNFPGESSWTISQTCGSGFSKSSDGFTETNTVNIDNYCTSDGEFMFTITDSFGDGLSNPGYYKIYKDDVLQMSEGPPVNFEDTYTNSFGSCGGTPPTTR